MNDSPRHMTYFTYSRLQLLPDSSMFASFSNDGSTKLWDVSRIEAKTVANRPKMTYSHQEGQIKAGSFCQVNRSIATASSNGSIHVFKYVIRQVVVMTIEPWP